PKEKSSHHDQIGHPGSPMNQVIAESSAQRRPEMPYSQGYKQNHGTDLDQSCYQKHPKSQITSPLFTIHHPEISQVTTGKCQTQSRGICHKIVGIVCQNRRRKQEKGQKYGPVRFGGHPKRDSKKRPQADKDQQNIDRTEHPVFLSKPLP